MTPPPINPKRSIVLVRKGPHTAAFILCATCGCSPWSRLKLAQEIGVPVNALSRFLNRDPVRTDVAATIRAAVLRVEE